MKLTKYKRGKDIEGGEELFNLFQNPENVKIENHQFKKITAQNVAYTHETRKRVNKECMEEFVEDKEYIKIKKNKADNKSQTILLYENLPIMSFRNIADCEIYNTELLFIESINKDEQTFTTRRETILEPLEEMKEYNYVIFNISEFHKFFRPAYCRTLHSAQGETIKEKYTIYDWNHRRSDDRSKYIALSRGISIHDIQIVA